MRAWPVALALGALGVGFVLGRSGVPAPAAASAAPLWRAIVDQAHDDPLPGTSVPGTGVSGDPREVIPLTPGTGQQPGAGTPSGPGQGQGQGECTVLMFRDGQFYRMEPGAGESHGTSPGGNNELFPLQPTPSPDAPQFPGPEIRS